jgi:glycosyltransferase involved in cell wall biosynthesis
MRILLVTIGPLHLNTGATQRTFLIFKALKNLGEVDTFWLADTPEIVGRYFEEVEHRFNIIRAECLQPAGGIFVMGQIRRFLFLLRQSFPNPKLSLALNRLLDSGCYDAIVCRYFGTFCLTGAFKHERVFVDIDDHPLNTVSAVLAAKRSTGVSPISLLPLRMYLAAQAVLGRFSFHRFLPRAKACFVCNPSDANLLPNKRPIYLPNIPSLEDSDNVSQVRNENALLVVASWGWAPNDLGLDAFLRCAWPQIYKVVPAAKLYIVGIGIHEAKKKEWSLIRNVEVVGQVKSVRPWYAATSFSIAPIEFGGGTNIKVLESLGYGRTVACTRHAARGYDSTLKHGDAILIANDWNEMSEICIKLLNDSELRRRLELQGQTELQTHYSMAKFNETIATTLQII